MPGFFYSNFPVFFGLFERSKSFRAFCAGKFFALGMSDPPPLGGPDFTPPCPPLLYVFSQHFSQFAQLLNFSVCKSFCTRLAGLGQHCFPRWISSWAPTRVSPSAERVGLAAFTVPSGFVVSHMPANSVSNEPRVVSPVSAAADVRHAHLGLYPGADACVCACVGGFVSSNGHNRQENQVA